MGRTPISAASPNPYSTFSQKELYVGVKDNTPYGPRLDDFKRAIPKHCFHRDTARSLRALAENYAAIFALYNAVPYFEEFGGFWGYVIWCFIIGMKMFSLSMLAHDCTHWSFCDNKLLNDICGHLSFAPLLTPFYPWQISHKTHHAYTNHIDKDASHPWFKEKEFEEETPVVNKLFQVFPLTGWIKFMPFFTVFGFPDGSHFWPWSKLFRDDWQRVQCVISDAACAVCCYIALIVCEFDLIIFYKYYLVPVLFYGLYLNLITYLQHRDEETEVYGTKEWFYVLGQTQVVDRTYGFGLDHFSHHVTDGHFAHHLFPRIPHYHLLEATDHIKKVLEPYKDTQFAYKHEITYDWLLRYFWYCIKLDCLREKREDLYKFRYSFKKEQDKEEKKTDTGEASIKQQ